MFQLLTKYCTIKEVIGMDKRSDAIETVVDVFNGYTRIVPQEEQI